MGLNLTAGGKPSVNQVDEKKIIPTPKTDGPMDTSEAKPINQESEVKNSGAEVVEEVQESTQALGADAPELVETDNANDAQEFHDHDSSQHDVEKVGVDLPTEAHPVEGRPDTEGAVSPEEGRATNEQPANEDVATTGAADMASALANRDPNSRPEVQLNRPGLNPAKVVEEHGELVSDPAQDQGDEGRGVTYSSHPIGRFRMGRFRFTDGQLTLRDPKDIEDFEESLKKQDVRTRNQIKKLDSKSAEAIARAHMRAQATKSIDSTAGGLANQPTEVGKTRLEDLGK